MSWARGRWAPEVGFQASRQAFQHEAERIGRADGSERQPREGRRTSPAEKPLKTLHLLDLGPEPAGPEPTNEEREPEKESAAEWRERVEAAAALSCFDSRAARRLARSRSFHLDRFCKWYRGRCKLRDEWIPSVDVVRVDP